MKITPVLNNSDENVESSQVYTLHIGVEGKPLTVISINIHFIGKFLTLVGLSFECDVQCDGCIDNN